MRGGDLIAIGIRRPGPMFARNPCARSRKRSSAANCAAARKRIEWVKKKFQQPRLRDEESAQTYNVVGNAEPRSDGAEKVTGKALYTVDVESAGHGPWQDSAQPLRRMRASRASMPARRKDLPGVFAVITREDQRRLGMFGAAYKDQTIVAVDKVRYAGDPVAAVAAVDEATAERSLGVDRSRLRRIAGGDEFR